MFTDKDELVELAQGLIANTSEAGYNEAAGKNTRKAMYYIATDQELSKKSPLIFPIDLTDQQLETLFFDSATKAALAMVSQFVPEDTIKTEVLKSLKNVPQLCLYPQHADHETKSIKVYHYKAMQNGGEWTEMTNEDLGKVFNPQNLVSKLIETLAQD